MPIDTLVSGTDSIHEAATPTPGQASARCPTSRTSGVASHESTVISTEVVQAAGRRSWRELRWRLPQETKRAVGFGARRNTDEFCYDINESSQVGQRRNRGHSSPFGVRFRLSGESMRETKAHSADVSRAIVLDPPAPLATGAEGGRLRP